MVLALIVNRFSKYLLGILLLASVILNIVLIASPSQDTELVAGGKQTTKSNAHANLNTCPVCPTCESKDDVIKGRKEEVREMDTTLAKGVSENTVALSSVSDSGDIVPDNAEVAAAAAASASSYKAHGLRSVYDVKSPVHSIVDVGGVGKMIGVVTPVWRLVESGSKVGKEIDDNVPAPGQVVGVEKQPEDANSGNEESASGSRSSRRQLQSVGSVSDGSAASLQLWMPKDVTRISIDVGTFISSPSAKRWWYWDQKAMVVAFEPNIVSGMLLTRISHPAFNTQLHGYWPACNLPRLDPVAGQYTHDGPIDRGVQLDNLQQCINKSYGHITSHMDRFVLFPVALSNADTFANFQYGFPGRADSGSLLAFNRQMVRKRQGAKPLFALPTPVMKMASILAIIPKTRPSDGTPILWDTLKIDAQGVDSLIIEGAGHLLRNFACILGEFDASSYKGVRKFDYRAYLVYELGFIMLKKTTFVNPSFAEIVHSKKALCFSSDVAVDYGHLGKVITKMRLDSKLPKQREHPELQPIDRG